MTADDLSPGAGGWSSLAGIRDFDRQARLAFGLRELVASVVADFNTVDTFGGRHVFDSEGELAGEHLCTDRAQGVPSSCTHWPADISPSATASPAEE